MASTLRRRTLLAAGLASIVPFDAARAQGAYPNRPIRLVTPYPAGGGTDIVARLLGEPMREDLGQPLIVDNRVGAGGNIGSEHVARSAPDGYTLLLTAGALAIAPSVQRNLAYDPRRDLTGVALLATVPLLLVVRPESAIRSVADLLDHIRRRGADVAFASFGIATPPHLVGERIGAEAGRRMTHVPYRGGAQAMPDILSGQIDVAILDAVSITPHVTAGRLRAIAITGPNRSPALPDLPTLAQAGVPFEAVGWHGVFAPAATPPAIIERLNRAFVRAVAVPRVRDGIIAGGSLPIEPPLDAAAWTARFGRDVEAWGAVARASRIELD
ncbi:Bug family tripartite tricarboxylate transporter substrate binding protein [Plastoroseomonas arctica]|uniref:Tripartite tricarboxylate transporter substrate binding protein n=1 Tax=Plastoroseomonas arctica TaxID=1509237 RepID=A0AAF1JZL5_9PROT|nr:tripartite tricarboxylate transporter substrate binding protein [Plastoroseomonas arctica]MBR0654546.1 tripartite tricarboxylate transporter substrate binding protein [Plastoroseomonas arctica]